MATSFLGLSFQLYQFYYIYYVVELNVLLHSYVSHAHQNHEIYISHILQTSRSINVNKFYITMKSIIHKKYYVYGMHTLRVIK